jgi:hypothetical protein
MIEGNTRDMNSTNIKLNIFVYGGFGSGKTWFCGTMPKPYIICTERLPQGLGLAGVNAQYAKCENFAEVLRVLDEICAGRRAQDCESICLDSLSDLTPLIMQFVMEMGGQKKTAMTQPMWGTAVDYLRNICRRLANDVPKLGKHVCVTARACIVQDEISKAVFGVPETIGKFAYMAPAIFDLALYAEQTVSYVAGVARPKFVVHTIEHNSFKAKDGLGVLAAEEPNDFRVIFEKVRLKKPS